MGLRSGEKAKVVSFRNRIEIIPMREIKSLRGYLRGTRHLAAPGCRPRMNLVDSSAWLASFC
jgi:hypothetical protein